MGLIPIQLLRGFLALLGLFFAFALARSVARLHRANQPLRRALTWILRTAVVITAVFWFGGLDLLGIIFLILVLAAFAGGVYFEARPRHEEEIHLFQDKP